MIDILIVDDHEIFREGIQGLIMQNPEFRVLGSAPSGRAAIQMAKDQAPDVVIMDIGLPDITGIEACRAIKQNNPQTKIIALSMHTEEDLVQEMLTAGADGYLLKDSAFQDLSVAVEQALQGGTYLSPQISSALVKRLHINEATTLTSREQEVLKLLATGRNAKLVADDLCISIKTVETHRSNAMKKLGLNNLADLTRYAIRRGLIVP